MNKRTRVSLFGGLVIILVFAAIFFGCSDDIVLEPLPSLLGDYEGRYHYITQYGSSDQQTDVFLITFRFSDQSYWMKNADEESDDLCQPSGDYILADGVEIVQKEEGCSGSIADPDKNPNGVFNLRQPGDSIVMIQIVDDVCKEILLIPAGGN